MLHNEVEESDKEIFENIIVHPEKGILWTRELGTEEEISYVLNNLECQYIFIGHTAVNKISLIFNKIWLTDNGISRAFNMDQYQYIDIVNKELSVISMSDEKKEKVI